MKNQIRMIKKRHLEFLKAELDNNSDEGILRYLHACIDVLEHELENTKSLIIAGDKRISDVLLAVDFSENEAYFLSVLFCNNTVQTAEMLHTKVERGKTYRVLNRLIKLGIVAKTNTSVVEYFIIDKYNPFKDIIENVNHRSTKLKNASAKIIKLLS